MTRYLCDNPEDRQSYQIEAECWDDAEAKAERMGLVLIGEYVNTVEADDVQH